MLDDFREWLSDNLRYILLGLAIILIAVIAFCVIKLVRGGGSAEEPKSAGTIESEISTEAVTEAKIQSETAAAGTSDLVKDDTAILTLVKKYYTAVAAKDITTLETIVNPWDEGVKDSILQNDVLESYNNISTYSKKGPVDNSYIVYVYYEGKVVNIDTLVPSLVMLYLTTDGSGNLVVSDRNASQEVKDYIDSVLTDADVQALINDVNQKCEQAKTSDPALKEFMDSLDTSGGEDSDVDSGNTLTSEMTAAADLNIRQTPGTDSAIMGVVTTGSTVTVLQEAEDGWVQISYNAGTYTIEGYVKAEYLQAAEGTTVTPQNDTAGTAGEDNTAGDAGAGAGSADTQA